jgi:hypothetical protein
MATWFWALMPTTGLDYGSAGTAMARHITAKDCHFALLTGESVSFITDRSYAVARETGPSACGSVELPVFCSLVVWRLDAKQPMNH